MYGSNGMSESVISTTDESYSGTAGCFSIKDIVHFMQ